MINAQEVYKRFKADSIFKGKREDFLIFPDNHPTTWIIAFMHNERFVVCAFYPHEANNHEFNDFEEFEMSPQEFIEHFGLGCDFDDITAFYAKKKIKWEAWL